MQIETIAKSKAREFLNKHATSKGVISGFEVWVDPDDSLIYLPTGNERIKRELLEIIAEYQLGLSKWDMDYEFDRM